MRLLSWNVLHSLEASRLVKFGSIPSTSLRDRPARIAALIRARRVDVACLQEVDSRSLPEIARRLAPELRLVASRLNAALPARDGCAIFAREPAAAVREVVLGQSEFLGLDATTALGREVREGAGEYGRVWESTGGYGRDNGWVR